MRHHGQQLVFGTVRFLLTNNREPLLLRYFSLGNVVEGHDRAGHDTPLDDRRADQIDFERGPVFPPERLIKAMAMITGK